MCCVTKRQTWALSSCTILLLAFALLAAGCRDSSSECGNALIDGIEECDGINLGGESCVTRGFGGGSLGCTADCTFDTTGCTGSPVCGNNSAEGTEVCDGTDLAGEDCVSQGFSGCGNDVVEGGEPCDGTDLQGFICTDLGFTGGTLACNATCANFDTTGCTGDPAGWTCDPEYYGDAECDCGCGVIDLDCPDGTVASCEFCGDAGSCGPMGSFCPGDIDPAQNWLCTGGTAVCGNDVVEGGEPCDGTDLQGFICADLGFTGGTLGCNATCTNFDTTGCTGVAAGWTCDPTFYGTFDGCDCGCGVIDLDCVDGTVASCEYCGGLGSCGPIGSFCPGDIDPAQNWLCAGGTAVGTLACLSDCSGFDTTGCEVSQGVYQIGEL